MTIEVKTGFEAAVIMYEIIEEIDPFISSSYPLASFIRSTIQFTEEENLDSLKEIIEESGEKEKIEKRKFVNLYLYLKTDYLYDYFTKP